MSRSDSRRPYFGMIAVALLVGVRVLAIDDVPVSAVAVGPLLAAAIGSTRVTLLTGLGALVGAGTIAAVDADIGTREFATRFVVVAVVSGASVALAIGRQRRELALSHADASIALAARLQMALEAGAMGTWVYDASSGVTVWDERLEAMYGYEPGTYDGTFDAWIDRVHPEDRALVTAASDRAIVERTPYQVLHRALLPNGQIRWLEARGEPTVEDSQLVGTTGVVTDVTDRMTIANELERSREESNQARHERDAMSASLQTALLPHSRFDPSRWDVVTRYRPGERHLLLGGDFFDVIENEKGLHVVVGDVCGHSAAAAGLGASLRAAWRAAVLQGADPAEALGVVDALLRTEADGIETFATACALTFQATNVTYSVAGHPAPLVADANGVAVLEPAEGSALLGFAMSTHSATRPLSWPWSAFVYTDGLIEGRQAPESSERYGADQLAALLQTFADRSGSITAETVDMVIDRVEAAHGARLPDDLAVVSVRLTEAGLTEG